MSGIGGQLVETGEIYPGVTTPTPSFRVELANHGEGGYEEDVF